SAARARLLENDLVDRFHRDRVIARPRLRIYTLRLGAPPVALHEVLVQRLDQLATADRHQVLVEAWQRPRVAIADRDPGPAKGNLRVARPRQRECPVQLSA